MESPPCRRHPAALYYPRLSRRKPFAAPTNNHTNENRKERVMAGAEFGKVEVDIVYCVP